jgi:hypothetical protein
VTRPSVGPGKFFDRACLVIEGMVTSLVAQSETNIFGCTSFTDLSISAPTRYGVKKLQWLSKLRPMAMISTPQHHKENNEREEGQIQGWSRTPTKAWSSGYVHLGHGFQLALSQHHSRIQY